MADDLAAAERRIEKALTTESSALAIGLRIKANRQRQGISVRDLAERAHISKTSVVNMEQGRCRPVTILKVCAALGLHIERFLADEQEDPAADAIVHRYEDDRWYDLSGFASGPLGGKDRPLTDGERDVFHNKGITAQMLMFKSRFPDSNFWVGIIELSEQSELRSHPGEEFVLVLAGQAKIKVGKQTFELKTGESICFNPNRKHSYGPAADSSKVSIFCLRVNPSGT